MEFLKRMTLTHFNEKLMDFNTSGAVTRIIDFFDFGGQDLSKYTFDGLLLKNCNFTHSTFGEDARVINRAVFQNCTFTETNFQNSRFQNCTFKECLFLHPDTRNSDLSTADFFDSLGTPFFVVQLNFKEEFKIFIDCHTQHISFQSNTISHRYMVNDLFASSKREFIEIVGCSVEEMDFLLHIFTCLIHATQHKELVSKPDVPMHPFDFTLLTTTSKNLHYTYDASRRLWLSEKLTLPVNHAVYYFSGRLQAAERSSLKVNWLSLLLLSLFISVTDSRPNNKEELSLAPYLPTKNERVKELTIDATFTESLQKALPLSPILTFLTHRSYDDRTFNRLYYILIKRTKRGSYDGPLDTIKGKSLKLIRTYRRLLTLDRKKLFLDYDMVETSLSNTFILQSTLDKLIFAGPGFAYMYLLEDVIDSATKLPKMVRLFDTFTGSTNSECVEILKEYPMLRPIIDCTLLKNDIKRYQ